MRAGHMALAVMLLTVTVTVSAESPYSGQQTRTIKALSEQDVEGYLNGQGMGFAKAAELNHYPGPRHVLDLADELNLDRQQIAATETLFDAMKTRAVVLGEQLVDKEQQLDRQFAEGSINPDTLATLTGEIGKLQAELRYVHLETHLKQKALLTDHQVRHYDRLRGYSDGQSSGVHEQHGGNHQHSH